MRTSNSEQRKPHKKVLYAHGAASDDWKIDGSWKLPYWENEKETSASFAKTIPFVPDTPLAALYSRFQEVTALLQCS